MLAHDLMVLLTVRHADHQKSKTAYHARQRFAGKRLKSSQRVNRECLDSHPRRGKLIH